MPAGTKGSSLVSVGVDSVLASSVGKLIFAQKTHASMVHTVANGTGTTNPAGVVVITLTGSGDELLTPPADGQPLTGGNYNGYVKLNIFTGDNVGAGALSVVNSEFVVGVGGEGQYETPHAYLGLSSSAQNNEVGVIFGIERGGLYYYSQRATGQRMANSNAWTNISGGGDLPLFEGDKVSVWVSSEKNADVSFYDANLGLRMEYKSDL